MRAIYNGMTIAESGKTIVVEGNHYFPPDSVDRSVLRESSTHSTCPWKGESSYYHIEVDGKLNRDAAWYYPAPKDAAIQIKDHIAFWKGVEVLD